MCNAPFRELLALIDLDGDADLPQNLLVNLADRRALHFDAVGVALFLNRLFRLGVADEGVARGDLARDGLHAAGSAGVERGLHKHGIAWYSVWNGALWAIMLSSASW